MTTKQIISIHNLLNLDILDERECINIGQFKLKDNDDVLIDLIERYYEHIEKIYYKNENLLGGNKYKQYDLGSEYFTAVKMIVNNLFPTYKDYCYMFKFGEHNNKILRECFSSTKNFTHDVKALSSSTQPSKEEYIKFVKKYAPNKIQNLIEQSIPLYINHKYINKSVYISGKSGSGKTEVLKTMIMSNIAQNDSSIIILDIHGDYSFQIMQLMQDKSRLIYIDLFEGDDYNVMPSINPFEISDRTDETLIGYTSQNISNTLKAIIGSEFSLIMESLLAPMLNTLLRIEGSTLYDLYKFCDDDLNKDLVDFGIKNCDEMNSHYLKHDFYKADSRTKKALKTRLQLLLNHEKFAQFLTGKSTFDLQKAMNSNKVIIFRFNKVKLRETMSPIGRFIISFVQTYAMLREELDEEMRPTTYMYIDEFQNFINEEVDEILSESRKYQLYLILAHQFSAQIENSRIKESILTNTQIKISGMNAHGHNQAMCKQFGVKPEELESLRDVGEFYFRKNNDKAFKFTSSRKLLDISFSDEQLKEWHFGARKEQLTKYYQEVVKKESLFVELSTNKSDKKESTVATDSKKDHYSKDTKNKLFADVLSDDSCEDELLDF